MHRGCRGASSVSETGGNSFVPLLRLRPIVSSTRFAHLHFSCGAGEELHAEGRRSSLWRAKLLKLPLFLKGSLLARRGRHEVTASSEVHSRTCEDFSQERRREAFSWLWYLLVRMTPVSQTWDCTVRAEQYPPALLPKILAEMSIYVYHVATR